MSENKALVKKLLTGASLIMYAQDDWHLQTEAPPTKGKLSLLTPSQCAAAPMPEYVVKGLLSKGNIGCIIGAPGVGKSLFAPYLAYRVARGERVCGMRTKQGTVFYVAAEDEAGMRGRVRVLRSEYEDTDSFFLVGGLADLLQKNSPDLKALRSEVKTHEPCLIIIDTLSLAFPGLEENSADGMGRVVAVARLLASRGAAVLIVHHDTKDGSSGLPRGHSLLNGALDMSLYLKISSNRNQCKIIRGTLTKNRNGSCDQDITFKICVHNFGNDDDGDPITIPYAVEVHGDEANREVKLPKSEKALLAILTEVLDQQDGLDVGISADILKKVAMAGDKVSSSDIVDNRRRTYGNAIKGLIEKKCISEIDGKYHLYSESDEAISEFDTIMKA